MAIDPETYRTILQGVFQCAKCGTCCKNCDPISVDDDDIKALAKHFKIPYHKALKKYTKPYPGIPHMRALKHTKPCKFYDQFAHGCKIYDVRPSMCRTYPFLSPQQRALPGVGIYDDCPGMLVTLEVFKQSCEKYSDEKCEEYLMDHPEASELVTSLMKYASEKVIFGHEDLDFEKTIAKKLAPHLEAVKAIKKTLESTDQHQGRC